MAAGRLPNLVAAALLALGLAFSGCSSGGDDDSEIDAIANQQIQCTAEGGGCNILTQNCCSGMRCFQGVCRILANARCGSSADCPGGQACLDILELGRVTRRCV